MIPAHVEAGRNSRNVAVSRDAFVIPGFRTAAAASGMRYKGRPDLALIAADKGFSASASGVFTNNRFCAAPVELCRENLKSSGIGGIIINAGIANACTGEEGLRRAREMAKITARSLGAAPESILVASTGVIGQQIDLEPVERSMSELAAALRPDGWGDVARAIMTTDTRPKMACTRVDLGGKTVTVGGVAKGSGMIAPNMATLLAFACTDASIDPGILNYWVKTGAQQSFNTITVDGDTSTNDTLLVLAGGRAGNRVLDDKNSPDSLLFGEALSAVLLDLAKQIVMDGEGATKLIEIQVTGATDVESAKTVAFTIANSPLVKTAFFGEDANWGRIVAAAGRAGVPLDPEKASLFFGETCVFRNGTPLSGPEIEEKASASFRMKEISVRLDLGIGESLFTAYTCDLSYDYIKINASYRS
ncbi:MAG: bifunctional glutamate N-acetyltransferase/amino-acid acetyltransferase ArgJ [Syntrophobacteraceae bacterium]